MGSKKNRGVQICTYCGVKTHSSTNDHVIAKSLLQETYRDNLPQVPSCLTCNNRKSKLENQMSLLFAMAEGDDRIRELENKFKNQALGPQLKSFVSKSPCVDVGNADIRFGANISTDDFIKWLRFVFLGLHKFHTDEVVSTEFNQKTFLLPKRKVVDFISVFKRPDAVWRDHGRLHYGFKYFTDKSTSFCLINFNGGKVLSKTKIFEYTFGVISPTPV